MYGLIQSGQISDVFEARAHRTESWDKPQWGQASVDTQEAVNKFSSLTQGTNDDEAISENKDS